MSMKVLFIGNSGSGKTTAARICSEQLGGGQQSTSSLIMQEFSLATGIELSLVREQKEEYRTALYDFANQRKEVDPAHFARECARDSSFVDGVRTPVELAACRCLFDAVLWIPSRDTVRNGTDGLTENDADTAIIGGSKTYWENSLADFVRDYVALPAIYVAGRYRHFCDGGASGEYDWDAMADEEVDEAKWAQFVESCGCRTIRPIVAHKALDKIWPADEILKNCIAWVKRLRPRDRLSLRPGWDDEPISQGADMEREVAQEMGIHIIHIHDRETVGTYLKGLTNGE